MSRRTTVKQEWYLASVALTDAYTDFILSLRAGMGELYVQGLGGWKSLAMVQHYAHMDDDDLLREHKAHSPVDSLGNGS